MPNYTFHEKGSWYYGLLISGAALAFKLEDESVYRDAIAGKPFLAYHVLLFIPRNPVPDYMAAKGGTVDPWILNGTHFISINALTEKYNGEIDELMKRTIQALENGPSVIKRADPLEVPGASKNIKLS